MSAFTSFLSEAIAQMYESTRFLAAYHKGSEQGSAYPSVQISDCGYDVAFNFLGRFERAAIQIERSKALGQPAPMYASDESLGSEAGCVLSASFDAVTRLVTKRAYACWVIGVGFSPSKDVPYVMMLFEQGSPTELQIERHAIDALHTDSELRSLTEADIALALATLGHLRLRNRGIPIIPIHVRDYTAADSAWIKITPNAER